MFNISLILIFNLISFLQFTSKDVTEIIIIGTVHEESENFNSDSLLEIFKKIKPDVILVESDTSYFNSDLKLKKDYEYMFPETSAITDYSIKNNVIIRPYDIDGRDLYLDDEKRLSGQNEFFYDISILNENGSFNTEGKTLYERIKKMINTAGDLSRSGVLRINSSEGSSLIDSINYYTYEGLKELIDLTPELSQYKEYWEKEYSFWNKRNETMLENILEYQARYKNKKIIVLCGFAHKNYLFRNLTELSVEKNFNIKEYYDF